MSAGLPGYLGTESQFKEHFATPIEKYRDPDAAQRRRTGDLDRLHRQRGQHADVALTQPDWNFVGGHRPQQFDLVSQPELPREYLQGGFLRP